MPKVKLTNTFISKVKVTKEKKKELYFDTDVQGLVLEVRATGNKTYSYRYNEMG